MIAYLDLIVHSLYGIVSSFITYQYKACLNDSPEPGEVESGWGWSPKPGGRWKTTMSDNNAAADKSRQTTDAMTTIVRADRAYHDPAQFHLHEFSGDQR